MILYDWFAPNVAYVVANGLFSGRDALTFDPDTPMTRAEFVSVIWRLAGKPDFENTAKPPYSDCEGKVWYSAAINWSTKRFFDTLSPVGNRLFPTGQFYFSGVSAGTGTRSGREIFRCVMRYG